MLLCEMMCIHDVRQLDPRLAVQSRTAPRHPGAAVYTASLGRWGPWLSVGLSGGLLRRGGEW